MAEETKENALADEILGDARRQAERKIASAKRTAERIVKTAQSQTEGARQEATRAAEQKLAHERELILAGVPHQRQIRELRVKSEVIDRLFAEAMESMKSADKSERLALLAHLSSGAISAMPGDSFTLEVAPNDAQELGRHLADKVKQVAGRNIEITVVPSEKVDGGVIARTADGRHMVDNSFATRLRRVPQELQTKIAEILFGDSPE